MRATTARLAVATMAIALAFGCVACGHRPVHETRVSRHYHHGRLGFERHTATSHRH